MLKLMYTYELTPNLKTKSYRVLSDGVEICRSLAKKTAKLMCDTVNKLQTTLLEAQTNVKPIDQPTSTEPTRHNDACPAVTTPHSVNTSVRHPDSSAAEVTLHSEGSQYISDALQQICTARQQLTVSSEKHGEQAEQHRRNAEVYGQLAEQFARLTGNTNQGFDEVSAHAQLPCEFYDQDTGGRNLGESNDPGYRTIEVYPS